MSHTGHCPMCHIRPSPSGYVCCVVVSITYNLTKWNQNVVINALVLLVFLNLYTVKCCFMNQYYILCADRNMSWTKNFVIYI